MSSSHHPLRRYFPMLRRTLLLIRFNSSDDHCRTVVANLQAASLNERSRARDGCGEKCENALGHGTRPRSVSAKSVAAGNHVSDHRIAPKLLEVEHIMKIELRFNEDRSVDVDLRPHGEMQLIVVE